MSGRIPIPGTHNFRDTGGYPALGGTTRTGQLFRSDSLAAVPPLAHADLARLQIGMILDLRSEQEVRRYPCGRPIPEAEIFHIPIFGGSRTSMIAGEGLSLEGLYIDTLRDAGPAMAEAVTLIAESRQRPILVHCTAGKDRTGLVIASALLTAGVDRQAVIADYMESALNLDGVWVDQQVTELRSQGVAISPRLFAVLGGSPAEAMDRVLAWLDHTYGSVIDYLVDNGMPTWVPLMLRRKLIIG